MTENVIALLLGVTTKSIRGTTVTGRGAKTTKVRNNDKKFNAVPTAPAPVGIKINLEYQHSQQRVNFETLLW